MRTEPRRELDAGRIGPAAVVPGAGSGTSVRAYAGASGRLCGFAARCAGVAFLAGGLLLTAGTAGAQEQVSSGTGAVLRALDKITGELADLEIPSGKAVRHGRIIVSVEDCRFPSGNPSGNAFAHLTVWNSDGSGPALFDGWMVAASPALNALDHPRYDVWVLRCMTP